MRTHFYGNTFENLVVSQVEYCCLLWAPTDSHNIALLENVNSNLQVEYQHFRHMIGLYKCQYALRTTRTD